MIAKMEYYIRAEQPDLLPNSLVKYYFNRKVPHLITKNRNFNKDNFCCTESTEKTQRSQSLIDVNSVLLCDFSVLLCVSF